MGPVRDPYELLDLDRSAGTRELKRAYRRLAKRYHPDAARDDGHLFVALRVAYETLSDPDRRAEWDRKHPGSGHRGAHAERGARGQTAGRTPRRTTPAAGNGHAPAAGPVLRPRDQRGRFVRADAAPWWEEIRGAGRFEEPDLPGARGDPHLGPSSSGAAWSSASRAYFRKLTRPEKTRGSRSPTSPPR